MELKVSMKEIQQLGTDILRELVCLCEEEKITYYAIYGTLLGTVRHSGPIPWDYDIDLYVPEKELNYFLEMVEKKLGDKYWVDFRNEGMIPRAFPRIGLKGYETDIMHIDIFRMSGLPNSQWKQKLLTRFGRFLFVIWKAKTIDIEFYYPERKRRAYANALKILSAPVSIKAVLKMIDRLCNRYDVMSTDYVGRVMGRGAIYPTKHFVETELLPYDDFKIRVPKGYEWLLTRMYGDYMRYPPEQDRLEAINKTYIIRQLRRTTSV